MHAWIPTRHGTSAAFMAVENLFWIMNFMNVKPTADAIEEIAETLRHYAHELDAIAERMVAK